MTPPLRRCERIAKKRAALKRIAKKKRAARAGAIDLASPAPPRKHSGDISSGESSSTATSSDSDSIYEPEECLEENIDDEYLWEKDALNKAAQKAQQKIPASSPASKKSTQPQEPPAPSPKKPNVKPSPSTTSFRKREANKEPTNTKPQSQPAQPASKPKSSTAESPPKPKPQYKPSFSCGESKENVSNNNTHHQPTQSMSWNKKPCSEKQYTEEQSKATEKVLQANKSGKASHYKVLELSHDASESDIKRAYHKKAKKLHPDKNRAPLAKEAFTAIKAAYDVLKSPNQRATYDRNNITTSRENATGETTYSTPHVPTSYNKIPNGTHVTLRRLTVIPSSYWGLTGEVLSYNPQNGTYTIQAGNFITVEWYPSTFVQNVHVRLIAEARWATVISYDEAGDWYKVSLLSGTILRVWPSDFFIPNMTVVRLEGLVQRPELNGTYGKVAGWTERSDPNTGRDTSYYEVQLSPTSSVHVKMAKVRL